jgi:hypothetical protein
MKSPRARRLSIVALTMIIVIIPFCLYYLFFVESQTSYFTGRDFRVLADIGGQIKSKIDNLGTSIINAANKARQDKAETPKPKAKKSATQPAAVDKLKGAIELIKKSGVNLKYDSDELKSVKVSPVQQQTPPIKIVPRPPGPSQNTNASRSASENIVAQSPTTNATSNSRAASSSRAYSTKPGEATTATEGAVRISTEAEQGSFWLNVEYRGDKNAVGNFHIKSEVASLVDPFVTRYVVDELNQTQTQERLFDDVLVAEAESGKVIFERGQPGIQIVALDTLSNRKGEKLDLKLADRSSSLEEVRIAGGDYKLFVQPLSLTLADSKTDQEVRWLVCGLTRADHFRDETYAVSYTVLIIFVFVVSLAALSWPLLKLKLMGPKDRLRRVDLGLTFACGLLGTALLTFLLLDISSYVGIENMLDGHLAALSKQIRDNFDKEIGSALSQLSQLNELMSDAAKKVHPESSWDVEADKLIASPNAKTPADSKEWFPEKVDLLAGIVDWEQAPYPYFNSVTWTDSNGVQQIKWTTASNTTAFLNVQERAYFTNARNGYLWKRANGDAEYVVDLVYSKNTGENVAVIATRAGDTLWVSSIDGRLLSLMGPVLPANYGYAVLDRDGGVLFHSDEVKNLQEQFFEECDNDRILRAAVAARTEEFVNANYLGNGHRLLVSPLAGTPWVLVVFRDKQMARTMNLELITLSLVSYLIFGLVVLLVVACIYLPKRGDRISWLWPNSKRVSQYNVLVITNVFLAMVFVLALIVRSKWFLVMCCFLIPTLAILLGALILGTRAEHRRVKKLALRFRRRPFVSYRRAYLIALVGYVGLLSVLPTVGFFRIARAFEMNLLVKHGQVSLAKGLERRAQSVESQYMSVNVGDRDEGKPGFLERRLDPDSDDHNWDVYDSFFFDSKHALSDINLSSSVGQGLGWIDYSLMKLRPLYNQSCVESRELPYSASADGIWKWGPDEQGNLLLEKDRDGRPGDASVAVTSDPSAGVLPDNLLVLAIKAMAIFVMAALVYLLARSVARNFFLLDQIIPEPVLTSPLALPSGHNIVLIRAPMMSNGTWDVSEKFKRIDLNQVEKWQGWAHSMKSNCPPTGVSLVLDHFESGMDQPTVTREKLEAIEQWLSEGTRVIVASTIDPLRFSIATDSKVTTAIASGDQKAKNDEATDDSNPKDCDQAALQARWSLVFSNFVTVYERDMAKADFASAHSKFLRDLKTKAAWGYLERIYPSLNTNGQTATRGISREAVVEEEIDQVVEQGRAYHQALWATCSQDERGTIIHIALDGMISSSNKDVRRLMQRGLVARDPALRLMDESFRRFVLSVSHGEDIDAWRQAGGGSTWQLIKVPILLVLLAILLFLFLTQKELYDSTISLVSALTAGVAILFRFLGMFQKSGAAPPQT